MGFTENLIQSIVILVGLISLGAFLRHVGILDQSHGVRSAKLVTNVTLPALIFIALSRHPVGWDQIKLAVVIIAAEIICLFLAWVVGTSLKLSRPQKGALMLTSGFGSSAFLGYALIKQVFAKNTAAISDAVVISELGVGSMIFTVGVVVAMYFGSGNVTAKEQFNAVLKFFRSPIFISVLLGFLYPLLPVSSDNVIVSTIYKLLYVLRNANTLLVTLTIGVLLQFKNLRVVLPIIVGACIIKLIVQPILVIFPAGWFNFPLLWKEVLTLEAAMPSATLAAVFSSRYGCDGQLASIIVFATTIFSCITILGIFSILG